MQHEFASAFASAFAKEGGLVCGGLERLEGKWWHGSGVAMRVGGFFWLTSSCSVLGIVGTCDLPMSFYIRYFCMDMAKTT